MNTLNIYEMIFNDVFCKTFSQSFFIFLCGGADKQHIRNKIRSLLEANGLQILYPEDLFMDMLNRDKKADLLEYENLLADNSDKVCIICESMGSAVELGAFIQNNKLEQKLIVCINQKFARDKSFIMMGPVKHLLEKQNSLPLNYNQLFNASIKYLVKSGGLITKFDNFENDEILSLSQKGYTETYNLLKLSWATNKTILQDRIRCAILKEQLNN